MARSKVATPMLEAYLAQVTAPDIGVHNKRFDWPITVIVALLAVCIPIEYLQVYIAIAAGVITFQLRKQLRQRRLARESPAFRSEYGQWEKVDRLRGLSKDHRLGKRTPEPVLQALEQAARTWHDACAAADGLALSDPVFAEEVRAEIDKAMSSAAASASAVALTDEQKSRTLVQMTNDRDLMARICGHIDREESQLHILSRALNDVRRDAPTMLRKRLAIARSEREIAEAELDEVVRG